MHTDTSKFQQLFRKYRLKSEFSTLSELGIALSEKGLIYEDSIFSHWQKGTRVPQNRYILLKLIELFIERQAITTVQQVNEFLSSAQQGYLSETEQKKFPLRLSTPPFQVPNEISNFSGRDDLIELITRKLSLPGSIILLHGAAGVGKTALAIKVAHMLKQAFPDGVLWYKVEEDNTGDILTSIARVLGEDISTIDNIHVRATTIRSLLMTKQLLLILDSAEVSKQIPLLIPNAPLCTTIITSQKRSLPNTIPYQSIAVPPFTEKEVLSLFQAVLHTTYKTIDKTLLLQTAQCVGNLPLAVHLFARQLLHGTISPGQLPTLLRQEHTLMRDIWEEDKQLYPAIDLSYQRLNNQERSVLVSASIFQGKDVASESIGYINGLSPATARAILHRLIDLSLVEHSTKNRYRLHPVIRAYVREKLDYPRSSLFLSITMVVGIGYICWWLYLHFFVDTQSPWYMVFSATYGIMAVFGGICGLQTSWNWGGTKTLLGKAAFLFSIGLFLQEFGQISYSYHMIKFNSDAPYPSIGDIGYFGYSLFYTYGVILLARASGIDLSYRLFKQKFIAIVIPSLMVACSYAVLLQGYVYNPNQPIKLVLDFGYPLADSLYISIAILIVLFSKNILDGIMRSRASLLLVALFLQFMADYLFLYNAKTFYAGDWIDFLCFIAYFVMTIALLSLRSIFVRIKST